MPTTHIAHPGTNDSFIGTGAADYFLFRVSQLTSGDTVVGGDGDVVDRLEFTSNGTVTADMLSHVSGIEEVRFDVAATNRITLTDAFVGGADGHVVTVIGNDGVDVVLAASLNAPNAIDVTAGGGDDSLEGGAGNDVFRFAADQLTAADFVSGGVGDDTLVMTTNGIVDLSGVRRVDTVQLDNGHNELRIDDRFFEYSGSGLTVRIIGGLGSDVIDGSGIVRPFAIPDRLDISSGGGDDTLTGGIGDDIFRFKADTLFRTDSVDGGAGSDTLMLTGGGQANLVSVRGVESIDTDAGTSLLFTNAMVGSAAGHRVAVALNGLGDNRIDGGLLTAGNGIDITVGAGESGADLLRGGSGIDRFSIPIAQLTAADTIDGGAGVGDTLSLIGHGSVRGASMAGVSHVEVVDLSDVGNTFTITPNLLATSDSGQLHVNGGASGDVFNIAADGLKSGLYIDGGDSIYNSDLLKITSGGAVDLAHVSQIELVTLSDAGNRVIASNGFAANNHTLPLTLGGAGDDVFDASAITTSSGVRFEGGGGDDLFIGGANPGIFWGLGSDTNQGSGSGHDIMRFLTRGGGIDTFADFNRDEDRLQFSAAAFDFNGAAFDTEIRNPKTTTDITGVDLINLNLPDATVAGVQNYLAHAAGGSVDEGVFVYAGGKLFHAIDASFTHSTDVVEVAILGASVLHLSAFDFI